MKKCRKCENDLNENNWCKSFQKRNNKLCNLCGLLESRQRYASDRKIVIERLEGKCACCGETNFDILSIDHVFGGGNQEKKKLRGKRFMTILKNMEQSKLIEKYQCLCYNCNYCIGFWGVCQHELL